MQRNPHANEMRKKPTDAERLMWRYLRNRQLGGYKFRRQFPIGPYIADFSCWEAKLIVELDGSQHLERKEYDRERSEYLRAQGFKVIRFWNNDVLKNTNAVLEKILEVLIQRVAELGEKDPSPRPSPRGEGEM